MSNTFTFPNLITNYQKVLLSDWPVMAKIIFKHSSLLREGGYKEEEFNASATNVLTDKQIYDAITGPYSNFFLKKIHAFTIVSRLRMALHIKKEDSFNDNISALAKTKLDPKYLDKFSSDDIAKIQENFNELVLRHNQQWEGQLFFWQISITSALKTAGLAITELESDEFVSAEPLSELLDRYDGLNITPIKIAQPLTFSDYFRLKSYLTILSALSRQHLPHGEKDIDHYMKALKKPLTDIHKAEKELIQQQEAETAAIINPIGFARIKKEK